ncbi:MAG: hypothetical protein IPF99_23225 [Deltaproteobacteria bacterium]|nr:hypothetical protein [Deltaproteobacteria bacterium]
MPATTVLDAIHLWLRPNETAWYEGHDLPTFEQVMSQWSAATTTPPSG